jgi:hypothetical protein
MYGTIRYPTHDTSSLVPEDVPSLINDIITHNESLSTNNKQREATNVVRAPTTRIAMKSPIFVVAVASAGLVQGQQALGGASGEFLCDAGVCKNGIYNQALCKCECIPPYCPDLIGDCTNPSNNCGGNPWIECVKGVNCPWWKNLLTQESCTTGSQVGPTLLFHLRRLVRLSSIILRLIKCIDFTL